MSRSSRFGNLQPLYEKLIEPSPQSSQGTSQRSVVSSLGSLGTVSQVHSVGDGIADSVINDLLASVNDDNFGIEDMHNVSLSTNDRYTIFERNINTILAQRGMSGRVKRWDVDKQEQFRKLLLYVITDTSRLHVYVKRISEHLRYVNEVPAGSNYLPSDRRESESQFEARVNNMAVHPYNHVRVSRSRYHVSKETTLKRHIDAKVSGHVQGSDDLDSFRRQIGEHASFVVNKNQVVQSMRQKVEQYKVNLDNLLSQRTVHGRTKRWGVREQQAVKSSLLNLVRDKFVLEDSIKTYVRSLQVVSANLHLNTLRRRPPTHSGFHDLHNPQDSRRLPWEGQLEPLGHFKSRVTKLLSQPYNRHNRYINEAEFEEHIGKMYSSPTVWGIRYQERVKSDLIKLFSRLVFLSDWFSVLRQGITVDPSDDFLSVWDEELS